MSSPDDSLAHESGRNTVPIQTGSLLKSPWERFLQISVLGPTFRVSDSVGLGKGQAGRAVAAVTTQMIQV